MVQADSANHPCLPQGTQPPDVKMWRGRKVVGCYSHLQLLAGLPHDLSDTSTPNLNPQQWRQVRGRAYTLGLLP